MAMARRSTRRKKAREKEKEEVRTRGDKPSLERLNHAQRSRLLFRISLAVAAAIALLAWFKDDGFKSVMEVDEKIKTEQRQLDRLRHENSILKEKIGTAQNDPYEVEKFAREKLNLARSDELIFRFKEEGDVGF